MDKLIDIPQDNYEHQGFTKYDPCVVCGRPCKNPRYFVRAVYGGGTAVLPEFAHEHDSDPGDLGLQPIGSDCLRRNPQLKPYILKS